MPVVSVVVSRFPLFPISFRCDFLLGLFELQVKGIEGAVRFGISHDEGNTTVTKRN